MSRRRRANRPAVRASCATCHFSGARPGSLTTATWIASRCASNHTKEKGVHHCDRLLSYAALASSVPGRRGAGTGSRGGGSVGIGVGVAGPGSWATGIPVAAAGVVAPSGAASGTGSDAPTVGRGMGAGAVPAPNAWSCGRLSSTRSSPRTVVTGASSSSSAGSGLHAAGSCGGSCSPRGASRRHGQRAALVARAAQRRRVLDKRRTHQRWSCPAIGAARGLAVRAAAVLAQAAPCARNQSSSRFQPSRASSGR